MTERTVMIGKKQGPMNYVTSCVMSFTVDNADKVIIKARGMLISKAVDVAQIVTKKFLPGSKIEEVMLGSEEMQSKKGKNVMVSTIEIVIEK